MDVGYYPGCALKAHSSSLEYGVSTEAALAELGMELKEAPDWNCCGASAGHMTNSALTRALNVRNLALAEAAGLKDLLAPCPLCAKEIALAHKEVTEDDALLAEAQDAAEMVYKGSVRPITLVQLLHEQLGLVKAKVARPLPGVKVACYYGCLHTRPPGVMHFDDTEQPMTMDAICTALGLEPVPWSHKTECCGAGFTMSRPGIVERLTGRVLRAATEAGAEAIVAACPMCHANLDMRQGEAAADAGLGDAYHMPILYLSQALGLALGLDPQALSLGTHFVDTSDLVERLAAQPVAADATQES
ncbi:CoB--CoM heterodisulfide reductase iron-sulfur subunit B family protein [bacterium]|nr:CoB--CoM heterodisulfide reductase iron-sulfur subunit B family protein [bacterium]